MGSGGGGGGGVCVWGGGGVWPLTLKFDRATWSFLKFDRRH